MALFTAVVSGVAVTAAQDVFEITAPATSNVLIHDIKLSQYTDFGDAAAEILSVTVIRGHGTTGSGGNTATPANLKSVSRAADSIVKINNTIVASSGSPKTLIADSFNIQAGWSLRDVLSLPDRSRDPKSGIWLAPSERLVVRTSAPTIGNMSITMNATLVFEETGIVS